MEFVPNKRSLLWVRGMLAALARCETYAVAARCFDKGPKKDPLNSLLGTSMLDF